MTQVMAQFQEEKLIKGGIRIFLLNLGDERAAGANLFTANHVIFLHPLLAEEQQEYWAKETQAIGRIRRYGQKKTVNIYRFLAQDTIDTEIYQNYKYDLATGKATGGNARN